MQLKHTIRYLSSPTLILMTLATFLVFLGMLQLFIPLMILGSAPHDRWEESPEPKLTEAQKQQKRIADAEKRFLPDGALHLIHAIPARGRSPAVEVHDVNDNLLWTGKREDMPYQYLSWKMREPDRFDARSIKALQRVTPFFSRRFVVPVVRSIETVTQYWRYEPDHRFFTGLDDNDKKIGYLGPNGFMQSRNDIQPFEQPKRMASWCPENSYSPILLWQTTSRLYRVDFGARTLETIFDAGDQQVDKVLMHNWPGVIMRYRSETDSIHYRPILYVRTKDGRHHLMLRDPNERFTVNTPKEWGLRFGEITATKGRVFLRHMGTQGNPDPYDPANWKQWLEKYRYKPHERWVELYEIDAKGNLRLVNRFEWTQIVHRTDRAVSQEWEDFMNRRRKTIRYTKAVSPPFYDLACPAIYENTRDYYHHKRIIKLMTLAFVNSDPYFWLEDKPHYLPGSPLNWILSSLMACAVLLHAWPRRTSKAELVFWLILVGLFNLAGLLTYLALNHTPVIKCPACGKRRGLECLDCVRCGAGLPRPETTGHELIFDTSLSAQEPKT
ncbi:MAG: hypothetical protein ACYST6_01795 [Planctomycetota bacterium]|jgi:hypothetical protein